MRLRQYVRDNRDHLTAYVRQALGRPTVKLTTSDLEDWIRNDESLYLAAKRAGANP
ncbi:MAG: hypothetical protein IT338_17290 [Thermomicrobiales bacterium]|nr:hypothetical protein [Thermomicrobiales bacterium]